MQTFCSAKAVFNASDKCSVVMDRADTQESSMSSENMKRWHILTYSKVRKHNKKCDILVTQLFL